MSDPRCTIFVASFWGTGNVATVEGETHWLAVGWLRPVGMWAATGSFGLLNQNPDTVGAAVIKLMRLGSSDPSA